MYWCSNTVIFRFNHSLKQRNIFVRIISGVYGGLQLVSKIPPNIRPTTDLSRESLFNVLTNLIEFESIRVLDLFAGTGALGIEAISRGAEFACFVDKSFQSISVIKLNSDKIQIEPNKYKIVKQDVIKFLHNETNKYDLIFADPPYNLFCFEKLVHSIITNKILSEKGIFVYELSSLKTIIIPDEIEIIKTKEFGKSKFYFLKYRK